jgi:hypothetical protein
MCKMEGIYSCVCARTAMRCDAMRCNVVNGVASRESGLDASPLLLLRIALALVLASLLGVDVP